MRAIVAGILTGLALVGCGTPQTSGIVAIGPDTYAVETRGRQLAPAVERGLTEATSFCTAQSRQTELLGTRINADSYQVAFRCSGGTGLAGNTGFIGRVPAGIATRNSALGPIPVVSGGRTVISGPAFPPPALPPAGFDLGTVGSMPGRPATVTGNPFAQAAPPPLFSQAAPPPFSQAAPPPFAQSAPPLATRQPTFLPPLSSLSTPSAPLAFQAPFAAAPAATVPLGSPSPFAPLQSPLAAQGAAPAFTPAPAFAAPAAPAFSAPAFSAPAFSAPTGAFAPLASPLAPAAPTGPVAFQPLASPASAPPAGFQPLPGAARPLSPLPPVASPVRAGSAVPTVTSGAPLGDAPSVVPPPAFFSLPR